MDALLLSAGIGSRLKPFTEKWPKCLMPIRGIPLIEFWIQNLINAGVNRIFINTHHLSECVKEFIKHNKNKNKIKLLYEKQLLGTAGTIENIITKIDNIDKLIVVHSDNLFDGNIKEFINAHSNRPSEALMSLISFKTDRPDKSGILRFDQNNLVREFHEKSQNYHGHIANGAVYILEQEILNWIKVNKPKDFSNEVIPNFIKRIFAWHFKGFYMDIGDLNSLKKAQEININKIKSQQTKEWLNKFKENEIFSLIKSF